MPDKSDFTILAVVAIVAVVALFILVTGEKSTSFAPDASIFLGNEPDIFGGASRISPNPNSPRLSTSKPAGLSYHDLCEKDSDRYDHDFMIPISVTGPSIESTIRAGFLQAKAVIEFSAPIFDQIVYDNLKETCRFNNAFVTLGGHHAFPNCVPDERSGTGHVTMNCVAAKKPISSPQCLEQNPIEVNFDTTKADITHQFSLDDLKLEEVVAASGGGYKLEGKIVWNMEAGSRDCEEERIV